MPKPFVKLLVLISIATLIASLGACARGGSAGTAKLPAAKGEAVIDYITKTNPYQGWALWPGKGKLYKGQHPHGAFLTTYVTPGTLQALQTKSGMVPAGNFIVKENYSPEKQLAAITVMYRVEGYNPQAGDWFWLKYAPGGKIEKEGQVAGCINCHGSVKANDWIFTSPIK